MGLILPLLQRMVRLLAYQRFAPKTALQHFHCQTDFNYRKEHLEAFNAAANVLLFFPSELCS